MNSNEEHPLRLFPELRKHADLEEAILTRCEIHSFPESAVLLQEGGFVKFVPLVLEGIIKVYAEDEQGNEILLYYISPGESCIMSATYCLRNEKSKIKAVVEEPARVLLVPASLAGDFNRRHVGWNEFFYGLFQNKYNDLIHIISLITSSTKDNRLIDYLHKKAEIKSSKTLNITHQEIADDLGATREVISRLLKKLENEGLIRLERRKIILTK